MMTGIESENFFKSDERKYILRENKEFLMWYNEKLKKGFNPIIDINQMQDLISNIVSFFEFKYPNRMLEEILYSTSDSINYNENIKNCEKIGNLLDISQLKYRLCSDYNHFLDCEYGKYIYIKRDKKYLGQSSSIMISVTQDGFLDSDDLEFLEEENFIKDVSDIERIEDLYGRFKSIETDADYSDLEKHIFMHKNNVALRNKILELIPFAFIYSKSSVPEYSYKRAKWYMRMFNEKYNIDLSLDSLDEIMKRDYSKSYILK